MALAPEGENRLAGVAAGRVLRKRVKQSIMVLMLSNEPVVVPPRALEPNERKLAAALFRIYQMPLYFEPGTIIPRDPPEELASRVTAVTLH